MKYVKQIGLIALIAFIGEIFSMTVPLPVPGSVYGMILMLICLCLKIIKLEQIEETADFLVMIMPLLLVSPCVGILDTIPLVKDSIVALVFISFITTVFTMLVTAFVTQILVKVRKKKDPGEGGEEA